MAGDKALTGSAGVHFVAFQLSSRGHAVGLTGPGVKAVDLMAANAETGKSISIQVKTMTVAKVNSRKYGSYWKWRVGQQLAEGKGHKDLFVTFVDLRGGPATEPDMPWDPDVFVVPSTRLHSLVNEFPGQFWCVILEKDAWKYRNKWDQIEKALA